MSMSSYEAQVNKVLLEAENNVGKMVLGDSADGASEEAIRTAGREALDAIKAGTMSVPDSALDNVLQASGAGNHTPETEEMFEMLRGKLVEGDYTAAEIAPDPAPTGAEPVTTVTEMSGVEITQAVIDDVAQTMGGEDAGWDAQKVMETVNQIRSNEIPQGDFKESFEAAVVHAYETSPIGDMTEAMKGNFENMGEEHLENKAVSVLNNSVILNGMMDQPTEISGGVMPQTDNNLNIVSP